MFIHSFINYSFIILSSFYMENIVPGGRDTEKKYNSYPKEFSVLFEEKQTDKKLKCDGWMRKHVTQTEGKEYVKEVF